MTRVPPAVTSFVLVRRADLEPYRRSPLGRSVARSTTPGMIGMRLLGDLVMIVGARRHRPIVVLGGVGMVLFAWLGGRGVEGDEGP